MTAPFAGLPAMPPDVLKIRRELHNKPGFHTLFDSPVSCFEQHTPKDIDGVTKISTLFYTLGETDDKVRFRVAVGDKFIKEENAFLELGIFDNAPDLQVAERKFPRLSPSNGSIKATVKTFYWVEFLRHPSYINIYLNGALVHEHKKTPHKITGLTVWPIESDFENVLCLETHVTCDQAKVSSLLPLDTWLNTDELNKNRRFQQSVNFKVGGSMTILGTYNKTGTDDKIKLAFKQGSTSQTLQIEPPSNPNAETMLYLSIQGNKLLLTYEEKQMTAMTGVDGTKTVPVKIVENFVMKSVIMTSGMINPQCSELAASV